MFVKRALSGCMPDTYFWREPRRPEFNKTLEKIIEQDRELLDPLGEIHTGGSEARGA